MRRLRFSTPSASRRADACALAVALVLPTLLACVYFVLLAESPAALQRASFALSKTIQFGFPAVWVLAIRRRKLAWKKKPAAPGLIEGLAFGLLIFIGVLVLYDQWLKPAGYFDKAGGPISEKLGGFGLNGPARYVAFAVFLSVAHSFLEEYYWRWFVFGGLRRLTPLWAAIAVSSLAFMSHHVIVLSTYLGGLSLATVVLSLFVALGGAVWAWMYHRSGSLWGPWLSHLIVDVAIVVVGYDLVHPLFAS